jgi:hypothetical protein
VTISFLSFFFPAPSTSPSASLPGAPSFQKPPTPPWTRRSTAPQPGQGRLLRRAATLLRRGPAALLCPSPGQPPPQLRRPNRKLSEVSTLDLYAGSGWNLTEIRRPREAPPPRFLTAVSPPTLLTPVGPSQDLHESTHGDQKPGAPLHRPSHEARPVSAAGHCRRSASAVPQPTPSPR